MNNYAISTADLATSLTKSSASLVAAGGNLEEAAALTATANAIVQDADSVGTALKTTSLRLRGTDTKTLSEEGLDSEGAVTSKSKLRGKIKALSGIDILTNTGAYKSTYQILLEISNVWKDMNDMDQAALLELISGKRNSSVIAAILQNPKQLEDAYNDAQNASGSAMKENEKYLDSIQGRIDLFTNAVQTFWNNFINDQWVKDIVDLGTRAIQFLDTWQGKALAVLAILDSRTIKLGEKLSKKITSWLDITGNVQKIKKEFMSAFETISKEAIASLSSFNGESLQKFLNGKIEASGINEITHALGAELIAQKEVSKEVATQILLKNGVQAEDIEGALAAMGYAEANTTLAFSFKGLATAIKKASLAFFSSPFAAIAVIGFAIFGVCKAVDALTTTMKEADEAFDDSISNLEEVNSELKDLNDRLDEINDRIKEINDQDTISFTDKKELENLREESSEIENQIALTKQLQEQRQKETNEKSKEAAAMYKNKGAKTGKTTAERTANGAKWGAGIGGGLGAAGGLAAGMGVATIAAAFGATVGSVVPVIGTIIGGLIGAAIGTAVGAGVGKIAGESEDKVGDRIDNMREGYANKKSAYENAKNEYYTDKTNNKKIKESYDEAKKDFEDYSSAMAEDLQQLDEYYSSIDLSVYGAEEQKELRQEIQDFYDDRDKWLIQTGTAGAKENALTRIFGENASDEVKAAKEAYIEALNDGKNPTLEEIFGNIEGGDQALKELKGRLYDMGLYVADATQYLKDFKDAIEEETTTNLYDLASSVATAEDAMSSLKSAFEEASESGQISAKTIMSLNETFGDTDGWEDYVNIMMSGTASTEKMTEATEALAEAWLDEKLLNGPLDTMEKMSIIALLTRMGVENAQEYVEDAQKEAGYNAVANALKLNSDASIESLQEIADQYGITTEELDKYIDELKELADLQNQLDNLDQNASLVKNYSDDQNKIKELSQYSVKTEDYYEDGQYAGQRSSYYDPAGNEITEEEYNVKMQEKEQLEEELEKLKQQIIELAAEQYGYTKEQVEALLASGEIDFSDIESEVSAEADRIQSQIDEKYSDMDTVWTVDVEMKMELQNKSDMVDELQSIYDTLNNAMEEYQEQGYFNVDTVQSLLQIEPKYLQILYDENGQINANADSLYALTAARVNDLGIQQAKNLLSQATQAMEAADIETLNSLTQVTYGLTNATWSFVNAELAKLRALEAEKGLSGYTDSIARQIAAIQNMTQSAVSNIRNSISSSNSGGSDAADDAFKRAMEYWERRIRAKEAEYDQVQNEIDLLDKQGKWAGSSYYEEQIKLEQEKLLLLQQQKSAAQAFLGTFEEGSDEWFQNEARLFGNK